MSGKTEILIWAVSLIGLTGALTDLSRGRIYNWLTLPALLVGLCYSTYTAGWIGLGSGLLGALIGLIMLGWMFFLGVMGGGDVKLLMALGAWGGARYAFETGILSVLLGGVMAVLLLAFKGRLLDFSRRMYAFILPLFVKELEYVAPRVDRKLTMPYGIPIAAAGIWVAVGSPLGRWGILPW